MAVVVGVLVDDFEAVGSGVGFDGSGSGSELGGGSAGTGSLAAFGVFFSFGLVILNRYYSGWPIHKLLW